MKKIMAASAIALLFAGYAAATSINTVSAAAPLSLIVDGQAALAHVPPFYIKETLYVPAIALLEYYPIRLEWDNVRKQLTAATGWEHTVFTPGSSSLQIAYTQSDGGYEEVLEAPVLLKAGHVYIPAASLGLITGATAELEEGGKRVAITPGSLSTTVRVPAAPVAVAADNTKVKLYAALKDGDTYKGFNLEVNGRKHSFGWSVYRDSMNPPQLFYTDVDQDGKPEAVVVFTLGTGTSLVVQEVHVVKPEQWKELAVPAADQAAAAAVSSSISLDGKDVLLKLELKGNKPSKITLRIPDRAEDGLEYLGQAAGIGAVTYYTAEGGKLKADTSLMIGMLESMGTLKLEYKAGTAGMELDTVTFEPHDTTQSFVVK
ncbi:stalk domain-containing protein [Paenibacillus sp. MMS20-IR301]|uniref:stalk domain-containing protein n=1 Tax=Paenibacillus sp. MMS20-IR301 TaxID=2895946 RepID=UPI0028E8036F|nr:stalk domain-containing protein [Paenibacillus sp. MMS20-IR301]WNS41124.1 stalk domain-containing protein [Paenibacillus sp. MMS20-IR301]